MRIFTTLEYPSRIVVEGKFRVGKPLGHIKDIGQRLPAANDRFTH
jgi:hypothetical protein